MTTMKTTTINIELGMVILISNIVIMNIQYCINIEYEYCIDIGIEYRIEIMVVEMMDIVEYLLVECSGK